MAGSRRDFLKLTAASLAVSGFSAHAQNEPVDVVKVMSFSCSFCLASEIQDRAIEAEVRKLGGRFVRAPIPERASLPGTRERVYYAARDMEPAFGEMVKTSLYRGVQDAQVTLDTYAQVYHWLTQDMPDQEAKVARVLQLAQQEAAGGALQRAVSLTISSGVERLPTYVFISQGRVVTTLDSVSAGAPSMAALREAVIKQLNSKKP